MLNQLLWRLATYSIATLHLVSIASNYACLNNVSTNHSRFVEAAKVSECQLMACIA